MANLKDTIINGVLQVNGKINADDKIIAPAFLGTLTGNSTSTTRLQTARKINGVAFDGTRDIFIPSASDIPIGSVIEFGSLTKIPDGWFICDGREISRETYSDLFDIIGTTYGAGDGSTTFNLPDIRGRVVAGYKSDNTNFNTLGKKGGVETLKLTVDNLPSHNHSFTGTAHTHTLNNHTHSVPAHAHGLNSHTHSFSATTSSSGAHTHTTTSAGTHEHYGLFYSDGRTIAMNRSSGDTKGIGWTWDGDAYIYGSTSVRTGETGAHTHTANSAGAHTHTVSGTSGAASGNTANSAALTTGASNVNTSSVAGGGTIGTTGSGSAINLLQPYFTTIFIIKAFIPAEFPIYDAVKVIDNLTTASATNALSANQGKILNDKKLDKTGGTMTGDIHFYHVNANLDGHLSWDSGNVKERITICDKTATTDPVFIFEQSRDNGETYPALLTIKGDGKIVANNFVGALSGNASSATQTKVSELSPDTSTEYNLVFTEASATGNANLRMNRTDASLLILEGSTSAEGYDVISLGNSSKTGVAGNKTGKLRLYSAGGGYEYIQPVNHTGTFTHTLPIMTGRLTTSTDASVQNIRAMAEATFESQKDSLPDGSFVAIW